MNIKERIIETVRNYPILYDKKIKEYKDLDAKYKTWKEVSTVLNMPGKYLTTNKRINIKKV